MPRLLSVNASRLCWRARADGARKGGVSEDSVSLVCGWGLQLPMSCIPTASAVWIFNYVQCNTVMNQTAPKFLLLLSQSTDWGGGPEKITITSSGPDLPVVEWLCLPYGSWHLAKKADAHLAFFYGPMRLRCHHIQDLSSARSRGNAPGSTFEQRQLR